MPSIAKGLTLDLALAGSKLGIVETKFGGGAGGGILHGHNHNSLPGNRAPRSSNLVYNSAVQPLKFSSTTHAQDATTAADLPRLRYQTKLNGIGSTNSNVSSTSAVVAGGSLGPPEQIQYTNRQKVLLEQDSNCRNRKLFNADEPGSGILSNINQSPCFPDKHSPNQQQLIHLSGLIPDEWLDLGPHAPYALKNRPFSSHVDHCMADGPSESTGNGHIVHRHSSDSLRDSTYQQEELPRAQITQSQSLQNYRHTADRTATQPSPPMGKPSPETLNWTLSSHHTTGISQEVPAHLASPSSTEGNSIASPQLEDLSRDYIDTIAHENRVIKQEVHKSLKRLLLHAGWGGSHVSKAEVNALKVRLHHASRGHGSRGSAARRGSIHSQDSGISSESITQDHTKNPIVLTPQATEEQGLTLVPKTTTMDSIHNIKLRKKKVSASNKLKKHKSRGSGKKSRLKSRSESTKKKNADDAAAALQEQNLINLTAYCHTMHVFPAEVKPKAEKPKISVPQPCSMHATTSAIYKERLPRVPQSTLTCEGRSVKENNTKLTEHSLTHPTVRKSLNLNTTKVSPFDAQVPLTSPRKSLHEGGQVYTNGAEEPPRLTKVYLSERQSGMLSELGIDLPCAPPATPMPEVTKRVEYIPSMYDIRAQRAVKSKLEALGRQDKKRKEKQQEQKAKKDKEAQKEYIKETKRYQRQQIYALNKVMTAWENKNFLAFCSANGIQPDL